MKKYKLLIPILIVMAVVAAGVCMLVEVPQQPLHFLVEGQHPEDTESVSCWRDLDGKYYVFLPSYANLERVKVELPDDIDACIGEQSLQDGMYCDIFELDREYSYTFSGLGVSQRSTIRFLKSEGVSSMFIDTQSGSLEYIHADKENREEAVLRVFSDTGALSHEVSCDSFGGRGNSTWEEYEKKPYNLMLSEPVDLLGLGSAQRWVLLANASDDSHMRNKIVYDFAQSFGLRYSPEAEWLDLYINGEYVGLYLLCERNEVHDQRVAVGREDSFLVSMEQESRMSKQNIPYVTTESLQSFRIHYPTQDTDTAALRIQQTLQTVENAILSLSSSNDSTAAELEHLIDLDSWARKYLIEEVFGNMDASYISQYYYLDGSIQEPKLFAGPVWDYDLSMGNRMQWQLTSTQILLADRLEVKAGVETPWFHALSSNEAFRNYADAVFSREMIPLLNYFLDSRISEYAGEIFMAARMNQIRWADIYGDFESEVSYIRQYMTDRVNFLNKIWLEGEPYHLIRAEDSFNTNYGYFAVLTGQGGGVLPVLYNTPYEAFRGWYYTEFNEPFDIQKPVFENMEVYATWEKNSGQASSILLELLPIGVIALLFFVFFSVDFIRSKKYR